MNKTREKILITSLELFNKSGIEEVSLRDISSKLNIRVGNLNYYFPSKNDIVHALCMDFIGKVDEAVGEIFKRSFENLFELMYRQADIIFSIQLEYRFIFNKSYAEIITSLPSVQEHFTKVLKIRFDEWMNFHTLLVQQKLAQRRIITDSYPLSYILNILALFWHQEASIYLPDLKDEHKKDHALSIMFHAYKPYLTKKGLDQLMPLLKKLEHY